MSWITSDHLRPVFATSVGFVVTPSRTPHDAASRISSMFAVSRKILTIASPGSESRGPIRGFPLLGRGCPPPGGRTYICEGPMRAVHHGSRAYALAAPRLLAPLARPVDLSRRRP